ncbi:penicillin-binding protein [Alkalihalobacterium elongatum]|uniref:penicillin-binding protein n=1 Tax=Alkalihalobacterium elongatum TaxID=2675466 RepID=UPI001F2BF344|nr:penicillin-binding protein [Alkalihalobacterium elongatum]
MNYYPMYRDGGGYGHHHRQFPVLPFLAGLAVSPFLFGGFGAGGAFGGPQYGPGFGPQYGPQFGPSYGPQFGPGFGPQFGPGPYHGGGIW